MALPLTDMGPLPERWTPGMGGSGSASPPGAGSLPGILRDMDKRYGAALPLVIGRGVVTAQVVYQGASKTGSGYVSGGSGIWSFLSNLLGTDVVLALCEAPVTSVVQVYQVAGGVVARLVQAELSKLVLTGGSVEVVTAATAAAWGGYSGTAWQGLAHSGTCHVRLISAILDDKGKVRPSRWEVQGQVGVTGASTPDADPADVLMFLLTDTTHGLGFPTSMVDVELGMDGLAQSSYRRYVNARQFYLSRVIERGETIASIIEQLLVATNSTLVQVGGVIRAVPLDDEASYTSTAWPGHAGYPYTPVTTVTAVGDQDFAHSRGQDPVSVRRQPKWEVFSLYPVDYTLRSNISGDVQYVTNHAEYQSDVWASANSTRRAPTLSLTQWILSERHALYLSYLVAQRAMYHRTKYKARVRPKFIILTPGDLISLTDSLMPVLGVTCRVDSVEEQEDGSILLDTLEWPLGSTKQFVMPTTSPGNINPARTARSLAAVDLVTTPPGSIGAGNLLRNSSFEQDADANGTADWWGAYNNSPGTEPTTLTIQAGGLYGGKFQRVTWAVNNTTTKGLVSRAGSTDYAGLAAGVQGGWRQNTWYVVSFWAQASGTNIGQTMSLAWNTQPSDQVAVANPPLTASWQRYVFQVRFTGAVAAAGELYLTLMGATQGTLDFDGAQVEEGLVASAYAPSQLDGDYATSVAQAAANAAQTSANSAQITANGKNTITRAAAPPGTPASGDYWLNTDTTTSCPDSNCKGHTLSGGAPQVGAYPHRKTYWPHIYNGSAWVDARGTEVLVAGDMLADSFATSDYTYSGTQGTDSEVATQGARMRNNAAPGSLPAVLASGAGIKVGSYTLGEPVVAALTALARTGTSQSDVVWYRGNIVSDANHGTGAPVLIDPPWVSSHAYAVGDRVSSDAIGGTSFTPTVNRDGANGAAQRVYVCTQAGTSGANPSSQPTGTGVGIVDNTCLWNYVDTIANCERLTVYTERVKAFATEGYLYRFRISIQPRDNNDNLDAMRYMQIDLYDAAKGAPANLPSTYWVVPDRKYQTPGTPTSSNNVVIFHVWIQGETLIDYGAAPYPFNGYVRLFFHNAYGYSSRDVSFSGATVLGNGQCGVWTLGGVGGGGGGGGGGVGGGCPAPEVGVLLADGSHRPAGLLRVGDRVWTIPGGPSSHAEPGAYEVTGVEVMQSRRVVLSLEGAARLIYSPRHLVMTPGGWAAAESLRRGDRVLTLHGERRVVSVLPAAPGRVVRVTTSASTYVTEGGVLNHNLKKQ